MPTLFTVYRIVCFQTGKCYVGQTCNFKQRKTTHFVQLKMGTHHNKHLQHAYNKYGKQSFYVEKLEENIPENEIDERECYWINLLDSHKNGYNISEGGGRPAFEGRKCIWNGIEYPSMNEAARALGINNVTMKQRVDNGYTCDDDVSSNNKAKATAWNGVTYRTLGEAANAAGVTIATMMWRIQQGYTSDDDMQKEGCLWNGIHYNTIREAGIANGISKATMAKRLEKGYKGDNDMMGKGYYPRPKRK